MSNILPERKVGDKVRVMLIDECRKSGIAGKTGTVVARWPSNSYKGALCAIQDDKGKEFATYECNLSGCSRQ